MVIAANYPLVGKIAPLKLRDDIVDRFQAPIGGNHHVNFRRARTNMVSDGQRAAPGHWRHRPAERREQRLGVRMGNRQHRDLEHALRLVQGEASRVVRRTDAGRQRIAGLHRQVDDRTTLHAVGRAESTLRIGVPGREAVVTRIGVNDATERPVRLRQLRLDSTPAAAVARDDDLSAHIDAEPGELLVVVGHPLIQINQFARDVTIATVGHIGRQSPLAARSHVALDLRFVKLRGEGRRRDQFERKLLGRGIEDPERLDVSVPTPGAKLLQHEVGIGLVVRRTDMVRLGRHAFKPGALIRWIELRVEFLLHRRLLGRAALGESDHFFGRSLSRAGQAGRG